MLNSLAAIAIGASGGAIIRWLLGASLNSLFPTIPLGTLVANMLGGYLMGIAIAVFAAQPQLSPEWRLMIITGFLGALTTFSTFSAEVTTLINSGRLFWATSAIGLHVVGTLAMTFLGLATVALMQRLF